MKKKAKPAAVDNVELYRRTVTWLAWSDRATRTRLVARLLREDVRFDRPMSLRSAEIWVRGVRLGRYTYADAAAGRSMGFDGRAR